jgi:pimeloyl-ACP methyl ester carboxylesterase
MVWLLIALAVLVAAAAAYPLWREAQRGLPDPRQAPGDLIELPQGVTHARWIGPARGPVIVAIHGLTTPSPVFDALAPELAGLGYRVLVYDQYGRGYSGNARGVQDAAFCLRQLEGVLDHYELKDDLTVLGYSSGAPIATAFAAANPHRMKRLVLIAPAGIEMAETPEARLVRKTPVLGDWLFALAGPRRLREAAAAIGPSEVPGLAEIQAGELDRRGYLAAVLGTIRGIRHAGQESEHRALGRAGIPVVAIWAEADTTVPIRGLGDLALWNRAAKQEMVAGAGHGLPHTHPRQVMEILRDVLREDWA